MLYFIPLFNAVDTDVPTLVLGAFNGISVLAVYADAMSTCAITSTTSLVYCFGENSQGNLGIGGATIGTIENQCYSILASI